MKFAFRADASICIGSGHVMRCLTLADSLKARGHESLFLTRPHAGHLADHIRDRGHTVVLLPVEGDAQCEPDPDGPPHADWLGGPWTGDATASLAALKDIAPDWLVVDHYALDARWEALLAPACGRMLVIDDLADRPHACDMLLDQNLGRRAADYEALLPAGCITLVGQQFALLRPEFRALRAASLARREAPVLRRILVAMGGIDKDDATSAVLDGLDAASLPAGVGVTVISGRDAPWLDKVRGRAARMRLPTEVLAGVRDMAEHMVQADLAIGAAGGTAWERCCLGLPSIVVVLAENQRPGAEALARAGVAWVLDAVAGVPRALPGLLAAVAVPASLAQTARRAAGITDGRGAERVCERLLS
jgi:UDP-2,4-diacetamido-2,4,6-trideoxy-beta-L-altropyranose hydrolase